MFGAMQNVTCNLEVESNYFLMYGLTGLENGVTPITLRCFPRGFEVHKDGHASLVSL